MSLLFKPLKNNKIYKTLECSHASKTYISQVYGMPLKLRANLINDVLEESNKIKVVITINEDDAITVYKELSAQNKRAFFYPQRDMLFFYADTNRQNITKERIKIRKEMDNAQNTIIVCSLNAVIDKVENSCDFNNKKIDISTDKSIDLTELISKLSDLSYERVDMVEYPGSFAIRGGIIDIFPVSSPDPVRIELWGDEINDLKYFDVNTQRSIQNINQIEIYPNFEDIQNTLVPFYELFDINNSIFFINDLNETLNAFKDIEKNDIEYEIASYTDFIKFINKSSCIILNNFDQKNDDIIYNSSFELSTESVKQYKGALYDALNEVAELSKNYKIIITSNSNKVLENYKNILTDLKKVPVIPNNKRDTINIGEILLIQSDLRYGFIYPDDKFILFTDMDIYGRTNNTHKYNKKKTSLSDNSLIKIKSGDYVIHEDNGLGIYRGIVSLENNGITRDYIKIDYADNASYYTPADRMHTLQIYKSFDNKIPILDKLGGSKWKNTKTRAKTAIESMAKDLIEIYAKRSETKGFKYSKDTAWQKEFEESCEFIETNDQIQALIDVKSDMESDKIMDRVICGDVGFGKTEIAIRAAFKAVADSRQVIFLAPTTILASQHYETFKERMSIYPINIELLSRFKTKKEQKLISSSFNEGIIDILIGTHMAVSDNIKGKNTGLLIIDEEQRLGVKIKDKIKELKSDIDVLTLTATPIPRTLHMSLNGIRDLSLLLEPPTDRKPIKTYVMAYDNDVIREAINREILRNGQVYFIHNRIGDITDKLSKLRALMPHVRFEVIHAKMSSNKIEDIMYDFINKKIDVLISTTIVETGLDIPNANTIIIDDATKLGLSQLYQLRGRVGRSERSSYAFLLYDTKKTLGETAGKRLNAIREYTELGSGINIATKDMEIRGCGNILGLSQHGHMQAIGYELYCKILDMCLRQLKGETIQIPSEDVNLDIPVDALLTEKYISNEQMRLEMYKKLSNLSNIEELEDIRDELFDRFGDPDKEALNLITAKKIKILASSVYITSIILRDNFFSIEFDQNAKIHPDIIKELANVYKSNLNISLNDNLKIRYNTRDKRQKITETIEELINFLEFIKKKTKI